jgi:hypothetical protein
LRVALARFSRPSWTTVTALDLCSVPQCERQCAKAFANQFEQAVGDGTARPLAAQPRRHRLPDYPSTAGIVANSQASPSVARIIDYL